MVLTTKGLVSEPCEEAIARAEVAEEELALLLRDLRKFEQRLRTVDEGGPTAFRTTIADELHEIMHPELGD